MVYSVLLQVRRPSKAVTCTPQAEQSLRRLPSALQEVTARETSDKINFSFPVLVKTLTSIVEPYRWPSALVAGCMCAGTYTASTQHSTIYCTPRWDTKL